MCSLKFKSWNLSNLYTIFGIKLWRNYFLTNYTHKKILEIQLSLLVRKENCYRCLIHFEIVYIIGRKVLKFHNSNQIFTELDSFHGTALNSNRSVDIFGHNLLPKSAKRQIRASWWLRKSISSSTSDVSSLTSLD